MANIDFKVGKGVVAQNASTFTTGSFTGQITSTLATGTSPFSITSTTLNTNLNADLLDGNHASAFLTIASLGTGVQTALGTAVGSAGAFVTFNGALGTPSSGTLTNATGLPVSTGVSGLGTGVATALAVNVGSAGAFVTNGGALGTPSSGTLTNATGLPVATGISGLGTGVATFLATPSSANLASAVTDETGSGALVFGTSPAITTSLTTASTTFALINTNATTVNFAGAATTLSIGAGTGTTTVNNNLTVTGNLTINGTTTTVNSTTITVDDPVFVVGGDTAPLSDDNLDRGIEFRWHNGTAAKLGFFGFDDSTGYFTFIPDATDTAGVLSGTVGDIAATNFRGALVGNADTATTAGSVTNSITFNTTGGAASGTTYNGSAARTIDYSTVGAAASSHTHGNITNAGAIGSTSGLLVITGASGVLTTLAAGTTSQWLRGDGTFTAVTLGNSQTIKFDTGTTEGTDLYTFNGSAAKTIDIKAGTNITLTKAAGAITIAAASTGFSNPMTTAGDLIVGGVSGAASRLAIGSNGTFLKSNGSAASWASLTSSDVGLGSVENTALSTWTGSTNIVTVGAITVDSGAKMDYNAVTISANTATAIHTFAGGTYRSAKFLVQLTQGTKYRVSEVVVLHDGTTAYAAEYGIIEAGGAMSGIAVDASYSAGTISLTATVTDAVTTNVAAKVLEIAVVA